MEEHELIVRVLASLREMAGQLRDGTAGSRRDAADFARFFREFADRCHHGKEEDQLFREMVASGFPQESGPIAVMLSEHDAGRREVGALRRIGDGNGPLTDADRDELIASAEAFVPLLNLHIHKENNILYPMARTAIPGRKLAELNESCARFDQEVMGPDEVAGLHALAEDLIRRYPADPEVLAVPGACGGCGGH